MELAFRVSDVEDRMCTREKQAYYIDGALVWFCETFRAELKIDTHSIANTLLNK